jgi:hypothetical protein
MKTKKLLLTLQYYCFDFWLRERRFCRSRWTLSGGLKHYPLNGSTNIPLINWSATFNEEMNPETINQSSFTLNGTSQIAGLITYSGKTATLNHLLSLTQRILQQ